MWRTRVYATFLLLLLLVVVTTARAKPEYLPASQEVVTNNITCVGSETPTDQNNAEIFESVADNKTGRTLSGGDAVRVALPSARSRGIGIGYLFASTFHQLLPHPQSLRSRQKRTVADFLFPRSRVNPEDPKPLGPLEVPLAPPRKPRLEVEQTEDPDDLYRDSQEEQNEEQEEGAMGADSGEQEQHWFPGGTPSKGSGRARGASVLQSRANSEPPSSSSSAQEEQSSSSATSRGALSRPLGRSSCLIFVLAILGHPLA